ncbi:MAG TPA: ADP-ribosylglycohydrolase family protein [Planctomycetes bacterium]|nr:ADP-ribosylglycohydrolase family protein [Planctomycetota bacterium]
MSYPKLPDFKGLAKAFELYSQLKHEYGAKGIEKILARAEKAQKAALSALKKLPIDRKLAQKEPNDIRKIRALRPRGPRILWQKFDREIYAEKLEGALLARFAGCTLGAPVEFWDVEKMEELARENNMPFPPDDYWKYVPEPYRLRYSLSPREAYTRDKMDGVPVDDDIAYTLLGLLVAEDYGADFTVEENGKAWLKYLPYACTAEHVALENLKKGVPAKKAGEIDNPYCEWIGADIRSDPWGYMAPAWPERAADMACRDAYLSHRRQGIYGEMFFSAAIAAAFAVKHPVEAIEIGLTEIPKDCALARDVRWALKAGRKIRDYKQARAAMDERFKGMSGVHTSNNACLTIWGLMIGGNDVSKVISETVAMGMDNDCTAATAGSIVGAVVGKRGVPKRWHRRFNNKVHSYLNGRKLFRIDDLVKRFTKQAAAVYAKAWQG